MVGQPNQSAPSGPSALSSKRKKKSSPCGPYLLGTFHCVEVVKKMYDAYKEMSRAVGVKKPQEAQKAKALWATKAAKDRKDELYDPAREE